MTLKYPNFAFNISKSATKSKARLGTLVTPHGTIETPNFIFCATKAAIKGLSPTQMKSCGTQFILANTYHLMLQPGSERVERLGGLHKFMGWDGPLLTDSGGFQVFSLGHGSVASEIKGKRFGNRRKTMLKISEEGAQFKSYLDGRVHMLTPEKSIQVQRQLRPDFAVVFDECTPFHVDKRYTEKSMHMTHRWANRCITEFEKHHDGTQALYGIVQGGVYEDLRSEAAQFINEQPFFAHAIGGSLGSTKDQMHNVVATTMSHLNPEKPVHLLGIGGISDIFNGVRHGIDTFDCVHPTRLARHGGAYVRPNFWDGYDGEPKEHISLKNSRFKDDPRPIDENCPCDTCQNFSRGYLHHLIKAQELLGLQALTMHNVTFMNRLMADIRHGIMTDTLDEVEKAWVVKTG